MQFFIFFRAAYPVFGSGNRETARKRGGLPSAWQVHPAVCMPHGRQKDREEIRRAQTDAGGIDAEVTDDVGRVRHLFIHKE